MGRLGIVLGTLLLLQQWEWDAEAKVQIRSVRLGPSRGQRLSGWTYVGKFGFDRGVGSYAFRARVSGYRASYLPEMNVSLETYLDEDWPTVEATGESCARGVLAKKRRRLTVGRGGDWGKWVNGSVRQKIRPHVWYFAISTCNVSQELNRSYSLRFEFQARQEDGSHFSYEHLWMLSANLAVLAGFTAFMVGFFRRCYLFFRSAGSVHPVIWTLASGLISQFAAQALHTGHLVMYRANGSGAQAVEVLSEVMFVLSQILQTSLLILIALGYTLLQSKIGDLDIVIPLCFIVAVIHVVLILVGKLQDESSNRFHDHEGPVGWVLLVLRLALFAWFVWASHATAAEGGFRLRSFLRRFTIAGSLYFLAYPVLFLLVGVFAPYLRAPIFASGQMAMQLASNMWLSCLFLQRGDYFQVSSLSTSLLPGGSPRAYKDE